MPATDPDTLRILGIDPGTVRTGFGLIQQSKGQLRLLEAGALVPPREADLAGRLVHIFEGLDRLLAESSPAEVAIEGLFHAKNARSALVLGHARGTALLAAARARVPVFEYAPREVKKALVGHGGAEKEQVRAMVRVLLGLSQDLKPLDASDGVAIAICHAHSRRLRALVRDPCVLSSPDGARLARD